MLSAAPCTAADENTLVRAEQAFAELRLGDAKALLHQQTQQAKDRQPPGMKQLYLLARIAILQGQLERAKQLSQTCVEQYPSAAACHEVKGEASLTSLILSSGILKRIGDARRARRTLEQAVQLDEHNMRARLMLVRFHALAPWFLGGSDRKAQQQIEICRSADQAWGYEAQALYDLSKGNTRRAVEGFAEALALAPQQRDTALLLARAYVADHQPQAAVQTLERLVNKYPRYQQAWLDMGEIAARQNMHSVRGVAALQHFLAHDEGESAQRRHQAALHLAQLYQNDQQPDRALDAVTEALRILPDSKPARRLRRNICTSRPDLCN